jgi:hypothetical protein
LVPAVCIASPISTSISALLSLTLSLTLSRWFTHLWESKGLELWWGFNTFDNLHTQMLPKNWLSNETLVLRYNFV